MKILIPGIIIFTIWCVISVRWYVCGIYELCEEDSSTPQVEVPVEPDATEILEEPTQGPLTFEWSASEPLTDEDFWDYLDSLKAVFDKSPASIVEITGLYDPQEINDTQFDNLGLARAENVKQLLLNSGLKRSIRVNSDEEDLSAGLGNNIKNALRYELLMTEEATNGFLITEARNKMLIHYPKDAVSMTNNQQVINALQKLAASSKKNNRRLLVVGHTDNLGDSMDNMKLGLRRATTVKEILLSYGMEEQNVLAESEGEAKPLVSNNTPRGRQQNRRVEIIFI